MRARTIGGLSLALTYGEWRKVLDKLTAPPDPWGGAIATAIEELLAEADTAPRSVTGTLDRARRAARSPVTTRRTRRRRR